MQHSTFQLKLSLAIQLFLANILSFVLGGTIANILAKDFCQF